MNIAPLFNDAQALATPTHLHSYSYGVHFKFQPMGFA